MTDRHEYPSHLHRPRSEPLSIKAKQAAGTRTKVGDVTLPKTPWEQQEATE